MRAFPTCVALGMYGVSGGDVGRGGVGVGGGW